MRIGFAGALAPSTKLKAEIAIRRILIDRRPAEVVSSPSLRSLVSPICRSMGITFVGTSPSDFKGADIAYELMSSIRVSERTWPGRWTGFAKSVERIDLG